METAPPPGVPHAGDLKPVGSGRMERDIRTRIFRLYVKFSAGCRCAVRVLMNPYHQRTRWSVVSACKISLGSARLLPSRSQMPVFSCRCSPTTVARGFLTPVTKVGGGRPIDFSPLKTLVFLHYVAEQACLGCLFVLGVIPARPLCPHRAASRPTFASRSAIPWADKY